MLAHSTLSGNGPSNRTISFEGDIYSGIRFDFTVQKDDASSSNLTLYVSGATNSQTPENSTILPFGTTFVGIGEIA